MDETRQLAQFAAQLQYRDLPLEVIEKAKELALHAWGVQLAGSTLPWSGTALRYVRALGGVAESTVINHGFKTAAEHAAFANSCFGHGFEMDDNHAATAIKGGSVAVPVALAIGERSGSSGRDFILATVVGYEVMTRVGLAVAVALWKSGHHATGACGPFGAAMIAGRLLGFSETQLVHALSIAGAHASGLTESPASGRGELKRIFAGMAAAGGIRAALLAGEGLTGPTTMLEGERGFCKTFGDESSDVGLLTAGLGREWQILCAHYKNYAQDGYVQPMTEALERLLERHRFPIDEIAEIRAGTNRHAHEHRVGLIREPQDLTSAQFSANFSLALFLVKGGAGFHDYSEDSLRDPAIIALSRRIHTYIDDEIEAEWQQAKLRGARITVRLKSGVTHTDCVHMMRAMTADDVNHKFRRLASGVIGAARSEQLLTMARKMEEVDEIRRFAPLLIADAGE